MKIISRMFALTAILAFSNFLAFADTRIRFAKGRTSATVNARIARGGRLCFVAGARAGQSFNATVSSKSGKVMIFESSETSYSFVVDHGGDQSVCVDNLAGATNFTLTVSIR